MQPGSEKRGRSLTCLVTTADRGFSVNALTVASSPEAFVRVCENLRADPVEDLGEDACWTDEGLLAVLVDDDLQMNVSALNADDAGEVDVRQQVVAIAEAILAAADL